MSEKPSRILLWVEIVLLIVPVTTMLGVALAVVVPDHDSIARATLGGLVVGTLALVAVWRIAIGFIRGGALELRALSFFWWSVALLGVLVAVAALVACLRPAYPGSEFEDFQLLVLGLPLLVPFVHLACEAWLRTVPTEAAAAAEAPAASPPDSASVAPSSSAAEK